MDDDHWFRRFGIIGFYPTNRKGVITTFAVLGLTLGSMAASDYFAADYPIASWVLAGVSIAVYVTGIFIAFQHMADDRES